MSVSTITSKGQTTIPKNIRKYLKLHSGDKIDFIIGKEGKVYLIKCLSSSPQAHAAR